MSTKQAVSAAARAQSMRAFSVSMRRDENERDQSRIGFIGIGKIAQSIIQAIVKKKLISPENIYASEINKEYLAYLKDTDVFQVCRTYDMKIDKT